MAKNLLIVESPAKVKTISKFLGKDYDVIASYGHIIDLPKSTLGVEPENDFNVKYITIIDTGHFKKLNILTLLSEIIFKLGSSDSISKNLLPTIKTIIKNINKKNNNTVIKNDLI